MDVLMFLFANQPEHPLPSLLKEADEVLHALSPGELEGRYVLVPDRLATREKVSHYLSLYKDQLVLFHYSGHAGSELLETAEESTHAAGIAQLLGQCSRLQLAFLNGCSTRGQVARLWEAGVPGVIATHAPVGDEQAADFSIRFYQALSRQDSLETAFELAKGEVLTRRPGQQIRLQRGFEWKEPPAGAPPAWAYFVREAGQHSLKWKLPLQALPLPPTDFTPNQLLIDSLYQALKAYSREVRSLHRDEAEGEEVDIADKRLAILNSLPAPLAEQVRKLMVPLAEQGQGYDQVSLLRAQQLTKTYRILIQLFAYTALAQLWESEASGKKLHLSAEQQACLRQFFHLSPEAREHYPFIPLIRCVRQVLQANEEAYFIDEWEALSEHFEQHAPFANACDYLQALHTRLQREEPPPHELEAVCRRAEQSLAEVCKALGFLAKYTLVAVRMIDVVKFRHQHTPRFRHSLVRLVKLMGGLEEKSEEHDHFMDSRSVLLLKKEGDELSYLNLSPFVIDENAFEERATDISKIYFFHSYDKGRDVYSFRHAYKPEDLPLLVSKEKFAMVKVQFEAFAQLLFNQEMQNL